MPTDAEIASSEMYQDLKNKQLINLTDSTSRYYLTPKEKERNIRVVSFPTGNKRSYKLEPNSDGTINMKSGRSYIAKGVPFTTREEMDDVLMDLMVHDIANFDEIWARKPHHSASKNPFHGDYDKLKGQLEEGDLSGLLDGITRIVTMGFSFKEERLIMIAIILVSHLRSATQQAKDNFTKQLIANVTAENMLKHWSNLLTHFSSHQPFMSMPAVTEGLAAAFIDFIKRHQDGKIPPAAENFISDVASRLEWVKIR